MEYYEVKEWLDGIVDTIRKQHQLEVLTTSIKTHSVEDKYYLHSGIDIVSDVMKIPLVFKDVSGDSYSFKYRYSITYRGIEFVQLAEKLLEGVSHENV